MIIAELCHNWKGDKEALWDMTAKAAGCGATFVKVQHFLADDLSQSFRDSYDRVKKCELTLDDHVKFVELCNELKLVLPMVSVYDSRHLPELRQAGYRYIKIGSAQCLDEHLIKTAVGMGFRTIVSTGGKDLEELPDYKGVWCVMHCVSEYPMDRNNADMYRMLKLKEKYKDCLIGFSDHSPGHEHKPSRFAMYLGVDIIERHFRYFDVSETKDGPVSVDSKQLRELCQYDSMPPSEHLLEYPDFGFFQREKTQKERDIISRYEKRWTKAK